MKKLLAVLVMMAISTMAIAKDALPTLGASRDEVKKSVKSDWTILRDDEKVFFFMKVSADNSVYITYGYVFENDKAILISTAMACPSEEAASKLFKECKDNPDTNNESDTPEWKEISKTKYAKSFKLFTQLLELKGKKVESTICINAEEKK